MPSRAVGPGPSAGRRTAPPGAPGPGAPGVPGGPGPVGPGGYAQVIRPTDRPVPPAGRSQPNPGRPADPTPRPADQDVYVYRDVSDPAPKPPAQPQPAADDAAYWYDLLAEDPVPRHEETRGPFEPLLSSSAPVGQQPSAEQARRPPDEARDESPEAPERARARKLEQLRDLYLTAEAIGEQNVDKHFDQILAQQRELISEYFRQPAPAQPAPAQPAPGQPDLAGPRGGRGDGAGAAPSGQATPPEGVSVRAEPPRAW